MKKLTIVLGFFAALVMGARSASACSSGGGLVIYGTTALFTGIVPDPAFVWGETLAGAALVDLALTIDAIKDGDRATRRDGLAHAITSFFPLAVSAITVGVAASSGESEVVGLDRTGLIVAGALEGAWSAALFAHGIYRANRSVPNQDRAARPSLMVAPTAFAGGGGLGALGRF